MPITISDNTPRVVDVVGGTPQTVFTVGFEWFADADLKVYKDGVLQTLTTHYTCTGAGVSGGGTVDFVSAVSNATVTIIRDMAIARTSDFPISGTFKIDTLNNDLDKITAMMQQLERDIQTLMFKADPFDTVNDWSMPLKAARLGAIFGFDSTNGDPEMVAISGFGALPAPGTLAALDMVRVNAATDAYEAQTATEVAASVAAVFANDAISGDKVEGGTIGSITIQNPQITQIQLGHASDTTIARHSSGVVTIEGAVIYRVGGQTVSVADGGTGTSSMVDGAILLGNGAGAIASMSVLGDGEIPVGDGAADPVALAAFTSSTGTLKHESGGIEFDASAVADGDFIVGTGAGSMGLESGATARTTMGVGTGDNVQFTNITATGAFTSLGIDDNATSNAITISSDEEVTMPSQPSFRVTLAAQAANVTGNGTVYTVVWNTETWDIGGNFNNSTGVFTAPITGKYFFTTHCYMSGAGSAPTYGDIQFVTSNRTHTHRMWDVGNSGGPGGMTFSILADLDASDTCYVTVAVGGIGADTIDIEGGDTLSWFSGSLQH
mgnify:CR=1 FL=1